MQKVTIWHNPRCTKSKETLELLRSRHMEIRIVEYMKTPPGIQEIEHALVFLRMPPRTLMRTHENGYRSLHLDDPRLPDTHLIIVTAMHAHPVLIQRPVVFASGMACIGRPPAAVLDIL
jgi:arsenate reductase (glutaredoxin)